MSSKVALSGQTQIDGLDAKAYGQKQAVANVPSVLGSDVLRVQVTATGTNVTVNEQVNDIGPPTAASWNSVAACYSTTEFRTSGRMIGFHAQGSSVYVGNVTVSSWDAATGTFDVTRRRTSRSA